MIKISYTGIEDFVKQYDHMEWDGWVVNIDTPDHGAWMKTNGVQKDGTWYRRERIEPNSNGFWVFEEKHVRQPAQRRS